MSGDAARGGHNPWVIALVVTSAAFMEVLDTTIVNVALPHIAGSLSVGRNESTWVLTSYLVSNSIVLPISGWLASVFGRKRYFMGCILGFTIASLFCGLATSLPMILMFRVAQGIFGGGLQPMQQAILLDTFPPEQRGRAFSVAAVATVIAPALGPTLGGWLTDSFSWRWIFLVNIPVGIAAWFMTLQTIEDPKNARNDDRKKSFSIDYIGLALIAIGFGCLQIALDKGEDKDWLDSDFIRVFAGLAVFGLVGAVIWLLNAKNPVVNLRLFANRNFGFGNLLIFIFASLLYGTAVVIPQFAQQQLGYTALLAGLVLSPGALLVMLLVPFVGKSMNLIAPRWLIMTGFGVIALSMWYSSKLTPDLDYNTLTLMRATQAAGIAFLFAPISAVTTATLKPEENNAGGALFAMSRNVGGSVGISIATAMITNRTQENWGYLSGNLSDGNTQYRELVATRAQALIDAGTLPSEATSAATASIYKTLAQQAAALGFADVYLMCGVLALVVMPMALLLRTPKSKPAAAGAH
jgi:DHA2 family multidrug resistance protein